MKITPPTRMLSEEIKKLIQTANCFCFDFDSTIITSEGIDDLAKEAGKYEVIGKLTKKAMSGNMSFREALTKRLDIIQPTKTMIHNLSTENPAIITPGFRELLAELRLRNIDVHVVSGGFDNIIYETTKLLGISPDHVHANHLIFDDEGNYDGFDKTRFTSESMGKARCVQYIKAKYNYKTMIMVGDGMTDSEARPPADAFIGFGGNVEREAVRSVSDFYVTDFSVLSNLLRDFDE